MNPHTRVILEASAKYPRNLEKLTKFFEMFEKGYTNKDICTVLQLSEQMYYVYRRQLLERGIINKDNKVLKPAQNEYVLPLPAVLRTNRGMNGKLFTMLQDGASGNILNEKTSEISKRYREYVDANPKVIATILGDLYRSVALFALYSNDLNAFAGLDFIREEYTKDDVDALMSD